MGWHRVPRAEGRFDRVWYNEVLDRAEVAFEDDVFLIARAKAQELTAAETEDEKADEREKDDDVCDDEGLTIRDGEGAGEEAPAQATIRVMPAAFPQRYGTAWAHGYCPNCEVANGWTLGWTS